MLGDSIENIFHFGSTAIPNMIAKPTVDILVILNQGVNLNEFAKVMINSGYICTKYPDKTKKRKNCMNFIVPYEINGDKQYKCYIHIREHGVDYPEILFCRYLKEHKDIARKYIDLKQSIVFKYKNDREGYMKAKTDFIKEYTDIAIDFYKE